MIVATPSGLSFHGRVWNLGDQGTLLQELKAPEESVLAIRMLEVAMLPQGIVDPGPYPFSKGTLIDWTKVSFTDILGANIAIRVATDSEVVLEYPCERCGSKGNPDDRSRAVDLREIVVYPMSDIGRQHLSTGEPIPVEVPLANGGKGTAMIKAILGQDMQNVAKLQKQWPDNAMLTQICASVASVVDPALPEPVSGMVKLMDYCQNQPWEFGEVIEAAADEHFGGHDTTVSFRCSDASCRAEQERPLPLDHTFYGIRVRRRRKRSLRSS